MMARRILGLAALLLAGGLLVPLPLRGDDTEKKGLSDADFVLAASASDAAEINLGQLAARQAGSDDVKRFARHMVEDHTKSSKDMLSLVEKKRLKVNKEPDRKHRELAERLGKLRGAEFDREYMRHMVEDHRMAVALFEAESAGGKDADVKAFAVKHLPVIREHLRMAKDVAGNLKSSSK